MGVREIAAVFMGINPDQNDIGLMMMRNEQATLKVVGLCPEATKRKLTETRMRNPKVNNHHHHYCLRLHAGSSFRQLFCLIARGIGATEGKESLFLS